MGGVGLEVVVRQMADWMMDALWRRHGFVIGGTHDQEHCCTTSELWYNQCLGYL